MNASFPCETGCMTLRCPNCGKTHPTQRDELDPPNAAVMQIICPACDDGDRHSPEYFDANGDWIAPVGDAA